MEQVRLHHHVAAVGDPLRNACLRGSQSCRVEEHDDSRPRRIAITPDDIIWYTDYARGYLGRFDPQTDEFREYASPGGPRSHPYGVAFAKGAVWYSESGVKPNTLVRFEPALDKFQSWIIPSGGGVVRNMMADHEGNIVIAESGVDRVALVEIK